MAAPPIGYCLFVKITISGQKLGAVSRAIWPQVLVLLVVLLLTTYIPQFTLVFFEIACSACHVIRITAQRITMEARRQAR